MNKCLLCPKCGHKTHWMMVHHDGTSKTTNRRYCEQCDSVWKVNIVEDKGAKR